jgi:GNAT superfamily N-acetyltransferase
LGVLHISLGPRRRRLPRPLVGCQHHHHVSSVESRFGLHSRRSVDLFRDAIEDVLAQLGMEHLSSSEHDRYLHLVALVQELEHLPGLRLEVTRPDLRPVLHLLDADTYGLSPGLLRLLRRVELVLPVVHDPADGRIVLGCDLDEIQVHLASQGQGLGQRLYPQLVPVRVHEAHITCANTVVDPHLVRRSGAGDATSLLFWTRTWTSQDLEQKRDRTVFSGAFGPNPAHLYSGRVGGAPGRKPRLASRTIRYQP